ncbi:T6SS immunity protein Tli3 family protein [Caballeronia sp. DA-9]|uniref:T6SS immunity protein Tli3 family protein n=1 Tax=Caballeronia sp. DA-9 TaxID=3436237 RepID=UPI003F670DFB
MTRITVMSVLIAAIPLAGCRTDYEDMTPAQRVAYSHVGSTYSYKPDPDAPVQVTYRIDDHRFVSLENYDKCYGDNYYNDTRLGIHQKVWTGSPTDYRGRVVVDDPSGLNIVLPTAENTTCGDRGCTNSLAYSTDSGRTFKWLDYKQYSSHPSEDSEKYKIAVTANALYIVKADAVNLEHSKGAYVRKGPLYPMVDLTNLDERKGRWETGDEAPPFPVGLRTPSGQDHFTCDASIRSAGQPKTP